MNLHKLVEQVEVHARPAQQRRFRDVDGRPIREVEPSSGKKGRGRWKRAAPRAMSPVMWRHVAHRSRGTAHTANAGPSRHASPRRCDTQQQQQIIGRRSQTTGSVSRKARFGWSTCAGGPLILKNAVSGAAIIIEEEEEENGRAAPFAMNYACPTPRVTSERQQRAPHARKKGVPRRGGGKPRWREMTRGDIHSVISDRS